MTYSCNSCGRASKKVDSFVTVRARCEICESGTAKLAPQGLIKLMQVPFSCSVYDDDWKTITSTFFTIPAAVFQDSAFTCARGWFFEASNFPPRILFPAQHRPRCTRTLGRCIKTKPHQRVFSLPWRIAQLHPPCQTLRLPHQHRMA